jgi:uncharacterized phage protein (TIGR01671 family)
MTGIKFRMWNCVKENPAKSKMFYDVEEVMACLEQQLLFDAAIIGNMARYSAGYNHIGDGSAFMQYTGIKDKNGEGNDVYDGDIFLNYNRIITHHYSKKEYGYVTMEYGQWVVKFKEYSHSLYDYLKNDTNREVIGNIYDDGHLIKNNSI